MSSMISLLCFDVGLFYECWLLLQSARGSFCLSCLCASFPARAQLLGCFLSPSSLLSPLSPFTFSYLYSLPCLLLRAAVNQPLLTKWLYIIHHAAGIIIQLASYSTTLQRQQHRLVVSRSFMCLMTDNRCTVCFEEDTRETQQTCTLHEPRSSISRRHRRWKQNRTKTGNLKSASVSSNYLLQSYSRIGQFMRGKF